MAGITYLDAFQEPALRGLVEANRKDKEENPTFGDRFLPDDEVFSTTFAYDVIKQHQHMAAMIGYGAEPPVIDRDEVASQMGEVAKMGLKYIATEEELLALNQARNNSEHDAMVERLIKKGDNLIDAIDRRVQVAKMEALTKGKFNYRKNNVNISVDYKIPKDQKKESNWDDEEHDVIGDLLEWTDQYADENGNNPDVILMSREAQSLLLKNTTIVHEARGANSGTNRVSKDELDSVLGAYGLPSVEVVSKRETKIHDVYTGKEQKIEFFPKNRIVMLSEGVGNFVFGPTVENEFKPGIVLEAKDKDEPIESILRVSAAGFPVVEKPSLILHADVFNV